MAVIHNTTMSPTKLELLTTWLPTQPWYVGGDRPVPARAGGFRLDDPEGEVGLEFVVVTDDSGDRPRSYHVPLSYRGAPLDGAEHALVGTSEHGVLGRRWIYDGAHDPVLVGRLFALLVGEAEPQAQNATGTPDPTVLRSFTGTIDGPDVKPVGVRSGPSGTDIVVDTASVGPEGRLTLRVVRLLEPEPEGAAPAADLLGQVTAGWRLPDGTEVRGRFVVARPGDS